MGMAPADQGNPVRARGRPRTKRFSEAVEPRSPEKPLGRSVPARTANRHRWVGRTYRGDRVNHGQGTRHNGPVTSGEGVPPRRWSRSPAEPRGAAVKRPKRLFTKNTGLCRSRKATYRV